VIRTAFAVLARQRDWPYLNMTDRRTAAMPHRRYQLIQMVAHGSANFHAAGNP
jgi:hypothetical protein